ncbi:uncharacterized protein LOC122505732 [Leptopilina heterotoma]|uniref:uncharacterized protein LOC122505732 n=1 Tax=Leptopilina heterotoma TaxID=63436 RepID=UPI001CA9828F|nr:uncharacterized protein LOC122505732 [Leptopilina heterotoma]
MALSVVMAVTNTDIKSMNMIKNRLKLSEALCIKIPLQEYHDTTTTSECEFNKFHSSTLSCHADSNSTESSTSDTIKSSKQNKELSEQTLAIRVTYRNRDILNLGANLREPSWHRWNPRRPQYDSVDDIPITCNSVFYRLDMRNDYKEDFPVKFCRNCEFPIPIPNIYS